jgi:hypothetical protein
LLFGGVVDERFVDVIKNERKVGMKRRWQWVMLIFMAIFAFGLIGCDDSDSTVGANADNSVTWYKDSDGDGWSDGGTLSAVDQPDGYFAEADLQSTYGDCNDDDALIHPGAEDVCDDGIDQDCSGDPKVCVSGTVEVPEGVDASDLAITSFRDYSVLGDNNQFEIEQNGAVVGINGEGDVLHFAFPDETPALDVDYRQTAAFLILEAMPMFISEDGIVPKAVKEVILSYPEVQALTTAIGSRVAERGWFEFEDVESEYLVALEAVTSELWALAYSGDKRRSEPKYSTINRFRNDLMAEIENDTPYQDNSYKVDINIYSMVPIYLYCTLVHTSEDGVHEEIEDSDWFIIKPMNSSEFLSTFFFADVDAKCQFI